MSWLLWRLTPPYWRTARDGAAPPWTSLPHAILVQALRPLPLDARARCACVCCAWRDASADPGALASLWFEERCALELKDEVLARLCARAGAVLREVRLDADACDAVTVAGALAALRQGGCAGVQRLVLRTYNWWKDSDMLSAEQAQQLAAACPALEHAPCVVRCESAEDVTTVCASLPGPLTLRVYGLDAARAASQLPARMAALVLRSCMLDLPCVTALCDALRTNTTLKTLYLTGVGAAGATALGNALRTNTTLTELHLGANGIGDAGAASLGEALRTNATLTALGLCHNGIGEGGVASLCEVLRTNATLKTLALTGNRIGDAGAASLAEAMRTNATITMLNLRHNRIGDDGAASICAALHTNATLTSLHLGNNGIGDAGATALGNALRTNATLRVLSLEGNAIGAAGTAALVDALRVNSTLSNLVIENAV